MVLPLLWPWLEAEEPSRRDLGRRVLGRLRLAHGEIGWIVREYAVSPPARRQSIARHLRAGSVDSVPLLQEHLVTTDRPEERFAVLGLLEAIANPGTDA